MKGRCIIWLNWPERPFRLNAADLKLARSLARGFEVVAVRSQRAFLRELPSATHAICWEFRKEWFAKASSLRVLATPGAGRELLPRDDELPHGVKKFHGGFHGAIMAETALAYMLAWCRGLYRAYGWQRSGDVANLWRRKDLGDVCYSLAGTKAVILGYGRIGHALGAMLAPLGVDVKGIRRSNVAELPSAVAAADWLVCILPSDTGTDDIVDAKLLGRMKRSAVLINIGRGNAVDERALAAALKRRRIAAAFLDVFRREPLTAESPLAADLPGLFRFPHSSAFSPKYLPLFFRELAARGAFGGRREKTKNPS
jgi:phosphoglycerate dehydrogenase-like enzyme